MNEEHQNDDYGSVLLAIDNVVLSATSIDLAVAIAASMQSRLHGLFIENSDLLQVASLPFSHEISLTTAEERPTDFDLMQRSIKSMASSIRKSIKQAAQASKIPWTFDYVSSSLLEVTALSRSDFSFTIVSHRISGRILTFKHRPIRRILLIEDHSPNLLHALKAVLQQFNRDIVEVTKIDAAQMNTAENYDLNRYLNRIKPQISLIELQRHQLAQLLQGNTACYDCAIVPATEDVESRRGLLEALQCPVILVS